MHWDTALPKLKAKPDSAWLAHLIVTEFVVITASATVESGAVIASVC